MPLTKKFETSKYVQWQKYRQVLWKRVENYIRIKNILPKKGNSEYLYFERVRKICSTAASQHKHGDNGQKIVLVTWMMTSVLLI